MTTITFIEPSGRKIAATVDGETTLMELAVAHDVEGVLADCGGACVCATCHCQLDANYSDTLGEPGPGEIMMLDELLNVSQQSRLACQIDLNAELDGLVVTIPPVEHL
jgi:ferredoxin, 2Fe-2S